MDEIESARFLAHEVLCVAPLSIVLLAAFLGCATGVYGEQRNVLIGDSVLLGKLRCNRFGSSRGRGGKLRSCRTIVEWHKAAVSVDHLRSIGFQSLWVAVGVLLLGAASPRVLWEPPSSSSWPPNIPSTGSKDLIASVDVAHVHVVLEQSSLDSIRERLGGTMGQKGEAGNNQKWLCYYERHAAAPWAIWLTGGELEVRHVMGFDWEVIPRSAVFDDRCQALPAGATIELPVAIELGQKRSAALAVLGRSGKGNRSDRYFVHSFTVTRRSVPWTTINGVRIRIRNDVVTVIAAWRVTTD